MSIGIDVMSIVGVGISDGLLNLMMSVFMQVMMSINFGINDEHQS